MEVVSKRGLVAFQISAGGLRPSCVRDDASRRLVVTVGDKKLLACRGEFWRQRTSRQCARRYCEFNDRVGRVVMNQGKCSRLQALPRPNSEENLDLEFEIYMFMQHSGKPDAFPTKEELISCGRPDLVTAIVAEGGWLAAGWGEEETNNSADGNRATNSRRHSRKRLNVPSSKISLKTSGTLTSVKHSTGLAGRSNGKNGLRGLNNRSGNIRRNGSSINENQMSMLENDAKLCEQCQTVEPAQPSLIEESTNFKSDFWNRSSEDDPQLMEEIESLFSFTGDLKLQRPRRGKQKQKFSQSQARNFSLASNLANGVTEVSSEERSPSASVIEPVRADFGLDEELSGAQDSRGLMGTLSRVVGEPVAPGRKKKKHRKKGRKKAVEAKSTTEEVNGTLDWIAKMVDQREQWMFGAKPTHVERSPGTSVVGDAQSVQDLIQTLEAKLVDARAALESGRQALSQIEAKNEEVHQQSVAEIVEAEDALEFQENAIIKARSELTSTRAQIAAVEGHLQVEIIEACKNLEENNKKIEMARTIMKSLRTARIVWPHPAKEVLVTGSFDGWNKQVKMQKSTAGVFAVSLPLYPGRYEIKFVVDGAWMVDTKRSIVYIGGYENNLLIVS